MSVNRKLQYRSGLESERMPSIFVMAPQRTYSFVIHPGRVPWRTLKISQSYSTKSFLTFCPSQYQFLIKRFLIKKACMNSSSCMTEHCSISFRVASSQLVTRDSLFRMRNNELQSYESTLHDEHESSSQTLTNIYSIYHVCM